LAAQPISVERPKSEINAEKLAQLQGNADRNYGWKSQDMAILPHCGYRRKASSEAQNLQDFPIAPAD